MANLFQPKRVFVPGLLSDEGLAAQVKELTSAQKATADAAPPNTSALEFAGDVSTMQAGKLGKVVDQQAKAAEEARLAAQAAKSTKIGSDIAGAASAIPGVKELGQIGLLTPERQAEEQDVLIGEAERQLQTAKDAQELGDLMRGDIQPPDWQTMTPDELRFYQQQAKKQLAPQLTALKDIGTAKTTPPKYEWWRNAAEVATRSTAEIGVDALKFPADLWDLTAETITGRQNRNEFGIVLDGVDKALTKMLPGDPARSKEFVTELSSGFGSMTGFMIGGFATKALRMGAGWGSGVLGAAVTGNSQYEDAQNFDANVTEKWIALIGGAGLGLTEAIPLDRAFFRADQATGGFVRQLLQNTTATSIEEFSQELAQAVGEDLIAKFTYDESRDLNAASWLRQATVGAIVGGVTGGFVSVIEQGGERREVEVAKTDDTKMTAAAEEAINAAQTQFDTALGAEAADLPGLGGAAPAEAAVTEAVDAQPDGSAGATQAAGGAGAAAPKARFDPVVAGDSVKQIIEQQKAYHGTPHKFDKFSMENIGTGEGAQAFGHGLYFAGNRSVAEGYRAKLAAPEISFTNSDGVVANAWMNPDPAVRLAGNLVYDFEGDAKGALAEISKATPSMMVSGASEATRNAAKEYLTAWASGGMTFNPESGALYQVEIPNDAELIDWDAPLSAQPQAVQGKLEAAIDSLGGEISFQTVEDVLEQDPRVASYGEFYRALTDQLGANPAAVSKALLDAGIPGLRYLDGGSRADGDGTRNYVVFDENRIQIEDVEAQRGLPNPDIVAQVDAVQLEPHQVSPLPDIEKGLTGPIPRVVQAAKAYANAIGLPHRRARSYVKVDTARAARVAAAYTAMRHEPNDPAVLASYQALADETVAQYQYVKASGIKIETILPGQPDPYPNGPRDVLKDINAGHIWYFPTDQGFGSSEFDPTGNPLLEASGETSDNGQPMVVNDLFRVVHDFFGHGLEGAGFGARGEENAWQSHMRLFTASAVPAMTSETRGQNSWVNYGPFGEQNRKDPKNTTYADQKTGLMPSWTWTEGVVDSTAEDVDAPQDIEAMHGTIGGVSPSLQISSGLRFRQYLSEAKAASPFGAAVHVYNAFEYDEMKMFVAPDGLSGFALKGKEIVSVFSHPQAGGGRLPTIIDVAVANGGKKLDAFDGKLVQMYAALGFKEVGRVPFDPAQAPEGWKAEWGTPDVVFMEYGGGAEQGLASLGTESPAFLEWDGGAAIRDDDGVPMVFYSGAPKSLRKATREMWMTPDRATASQFGEAGKGGNFAQDAAFDGDGNNIGGAVFTFYARMENPVEIDWQGNSWNAGPDTEPQIIYRAVDSAFESYGDAEQAIADQQDSARSDAEEAFRDDMANRMYVEEVGDQFEVRLKPEQGETVADLEYRVGNARNYEASRREALDKAIAQQDTLGAALVESVRNQYKTAIAQLAEFQRQLEALRAAPPAEDEVIGAFDTEEEARDFENAYTEEKAAEAGVAAAEEVDTAIDEEPDYDSENPNAQTTDSEVDRAKYKGYDGVIFRDVDEGSGPVDVYVIIEPGNAKSTANIGTYNREDPDILRMTGTATQRMPYALEPTRPTKGVASTPGVEAPNDVRLTKIAENLTKLLNLTVRHGRLVGGAGSADVMGQFNRRTGVIRLRTWTDLSTLAHEAGHALNDQMAAPLDAFVNSHLAEINKVALLYQGDLSQATGAVKRREGFAEFFRVYTMTPHFARQKWTQLTADFEALLDKEDPQVKTGLNAIAAQVTAWQQLPSGRLIENTVIDGRREQGLGPAMKELRDLGFKTWMQELVRRNVQWSTNRYAALNRLVTDLLNEGEVNRGAPIELERADDPRVLARLARNSGSRGMIEVTDGVIGYKGIKSSSKGLREAIMVSQGVDPNTTPKALDEERLHTFSAYLVARRALEEFRRYDAGEIDRQPVAFSKGDAVQAVREWEAKYPDFVKAADIVHGYGMALWQKSYDAGLIAKETYEENLTRQFYVPLQRDMSDKRAALGDSALTTKGSGPLRSIVRRFRGSDRDIIDPLSILMQKTFALEQLIAENDAKKALAVLADRVGAAGALVERIPASQLIGQEFGVREVARQLTGLDDIADTDAADLMTILGASIKEGDTISLFRSQQASAKGEPVLFFWENGKIAAIQVKDGDIGADVVNTLNAVGRENMDKLLEGVAATSTVFRTAITSWPDFLLVNFIRDQMSAWILNDVGFVPFVSGIRGVVDEVRQKGWAKLYNYGQGIMGGMNVAAQHTAHVDRDIRSLRAKGYIANVFGDVRSGWDFPNAIKGLARISAVTETGTRLGLFRGAYNRAKREGLDDYQATIEASYTATDYIDFGLNGSKMLTTRRLIPFLNAQIQGFYKMVRTLGGDEVAQRKGLLFALTSYFKNINNLPLSRLEKQQLRTGRKAWLKMMSLGLISAAIYYAFKDDEDYQEAGEYLRTTGWVIPMGDGRIFYIPKPFELAMIANAVERGLEGAAGDATALDRFKRGVALNLTPPTTPPLFALGFEVPNNIDTFTGREIVPSYMRALEPELQYDHTTSSMAKWLGDQFNWSPMVIDHVLGAFGASAYRDIATMTNAADPTRPSMTATDAPILRRFVRDVRRGSVSAQDFWSQASSTNGALARAAASYKHEIDAGNEPAANRRLGAMTSDQRAYAVLMAQFKVEEKRLNPFYRATQITTLVSKMRRESASSLSLGDTTVKDSLDTIPLTAGKKREVDTILSEIARREVRNTLIATGQPGWKDKEILPVEPTIELLLNVAPEVYDEFQRRWKKAKVYDAQTVYDYWPDVRDRLVQDGEFAVLNDAVAVASAGL